MEKRSDSPSVCQEKLYAAITCNARLTREKRARQQFSCEEIEDMQKIKTTPWQEKFYAAISCNGRLVRKNRRLQQEIVDLQDLYQALL